MKRVIAALVVVAVASLLLVQPAAAHLVGVKAPANPCKLLKKKEVKELLLNKRVVKVQRESKGNIAQCTWRTRFYQTPRFADAESPFSLVLSVEPLEGVTDEIEELRSRADDFDSISVDRVDGVGDEAFRHFADLIIVTGDIVLQVGVGNYDTSKPPEPDVDAIADEAAALALDRL